MGKFPFQLLIERGFGEKQTESLTCTALLRAIPGRREVYDALWDGRAVVVKVLLHRISAKRHLRRDWRGLKGLRQRGLNSPKPLFYGRTGRHALAVVTEKIDNAPTVAEVWASTVGAARRCELLCSISRELAKQHSSGVLQRDLQLGNFLMKNEKLFVLDPAEMRFFRREVGRKQAIAQLALLASIVLHEDADTVKRVCEEYAKARSWELRQSDMALFYRKLDRYRKKRIHNALTKSLRASRRHQRIKARGYCGSVCRGAFEEEDFYKFLGSVDELMASGQILKEGKACFVSRVNLDGKDVVVKRYDHKGIIHSLRHTIKKSRALRGWLHAQRLWRLNIGTPRPLAYVEQRKGLLLWQSYLVTEYVGGQNLYDILRDYRTGEQERWRVIEQVAELFEKLGKYRITHGDLKHTNILVTGANAVLTDLDGMKVHRFNWAYKIWRAKDVARFLRKADFSPALNDYCRMLILGQSSSGGKFSGDFDKVRLSDWMVQIRRDFPKREIGKLILMDGRSGSGSGQVARVRSSDYTRVYRCSVTFDGVEQVLYLKRYLYHSVWDFAKRLFRSSRAKSAFEASLMLEKSGFDTPCVVGLLERRLGPFLTDNLLVTKEVGDSMKLGAYLPRFCGRPGKQRLQEKRRLISSFGETVGRMHAEGIFHGDLGQGNVLVQEEGSAWRFFFIDNERTRKFSHLPAGMRLKNLVQINMFQRGISNADRMRFFKSYLCQNPYVRGHRSRLAQKVIIKTHLRLKRKTKNSGHVEHTCPDRT